MQDRVESDARKQAADEMAAVEELPVAATLRKRMLEAEHKYPTVYGSSEMAQRLDWGPVHDDIEKAWEEQYSTVKRLLGHAACHFQEACAHEACRCTHSYGLSAVCFSCGVALQLFSPRWREATWTRCSAHFL